MKGFVPTPVNTVELMVEQLFRHATPERESTILDPGCGDGGLIRGIVDWCEGRRLPLPRIVGVERDPLLAAAARSLFARYPCIKIVTGDFLAAKPMRYHFLIGNPPYVPITGITGAERTQYRSRFESASGRFDLYLLFFEQALESLHPGGRLVFITPEKFLYVESARPLRRRLGQKRVEEIRFVDERTFGNLVTYPTITTVVNKPGGQKTRVVGRDGGTASVTVPANGASWLPCVNGEISATEQVTLSDVCLRVSCGVATGADRVFVCRTKDLESELLAYAYPTLAGRELTLGSSAFSVQYSMLIPYSAKGRLLDEAALGALGTYLDLPERRSRLMHRTCVRRKPWYAFHETPPLPVILRPKILCKDIAARPQFWVSRRPDLVPRHSVYYIVPKNPDAIEALCQYLNSTTAAKWLVSHCQRAANGFVRLQSHILKQLPIPPELASVVALSRQDIEERGAKRTAHPRSQLSLPLSTSESAGV